MKNKRVFIPLVVAIAIIVLGTSYEKLNKNINFINNKEIDNKKNLVYIDPGHQEKGDPTLEPIGPGSSKFKPRISSGATGVATNKPEYALNLETSTVLKNILENKGFKVKMTREKNDVNISNAERAIMANKDNAKLIIRMHADSIDDGSKTGASLLIPTKNGKYTSGIYEKSNEYAKIIKENLENSKIKVNGIFERDDLTGFNWSKVPVVLVEMGFVSNYTEDKLLSNPEYQRKMMQSIADGIEESLNK